MLSKKGASRREENPPSRLGNVDEEKVCKSNEEEDVEGVRRRRL